MTLEVNYPTNGVDAHQHDVDQRYEEGLVPSLTLQNDDIPPTDWMVLPRAGRVEN